MLSVRVVCCRTACPLPPPPYPPPGDTGGSVGGQLCGREFGSMRIQCVQLVCAIDNSNVTCSLDSRGVEAASRHRHRPRPRPLLFMELRSYAADNGACVQFLCNYSLPFLNIRSASTKPPPPPPPSFPPGDFGVRLRSRYRQACLH